MSRESKVVGVRGARALELCLLDDLRALVDPLPLDRPVCIVVPSAGLRQHLQAAIARRFGAVLGVQVQTAAHVAADVLLAAGRTAPRGSAMFDVLARRAARSQPALEDALGNLDDGYEVATGAIRDLLSAGLDAETAAAATSALGALPDPDGRARAVSLVRAAATTRRDLLHLGYGRRADVLALAAEAVEHGEVALSARVYLVHGFADAPGTASRFLRALFDHADVHLYVDRPADPAELDVEDRGVRFVDAFLARLLPSEVETVRNPASERPEIACFTASGSANEIREVAHRVRSLLDAGARPESIAIVGRHLDGYAAPLRRHFDELAIPFSGGALPERFHPAERRVDALLELLEQRGATLVDRWLEARRGHRRENEIRLAFRTIGVTRLDEAATTDADEWIEAGRDSLALPIRRGFVEGGGPSVPDDEDDHEDRSSAGPDANTLEVRAQRCTLARQRLEAEINDARMLRDHLDAWPDRARLRDHVTHARGLDSLLRLGQRGKTLRSAPARLLVSRWQEALRQLGDLDRADLEVDRVELLVLLGGALRQKFAGLGGSGGGVQVLDVAHARALTFDHLFVIGLNRNVFPRPVREDPLLGDGVRQALRGVLPDLALANARHDEERYLFAQLCGAADALTLSWQRSDAEGRELAPSPFIQRLHLHDPDRAACSDADSASGPRADLEVRAPGESRRDIPRTLPDPDAEHRGTAVAALELAAHRGDRRSWRALLATALQETRRRFLPASGSVPSVTDLADIRFRVLSEFDPDRGTDAGRARLSKSGPWFGAIGRHDASTRDPRRSRLYVTTLEAIARCPWQGLLRRFLRLEPMPDPLAGPPAFDLLLIGNTVHRTLEELVRAASDSWPTTLEDATQRDPINVSRPSGTDVDTVLRRVAEDTGRDSGLHLPGLIDVLVRRCRPFVTAALAADWPDDTRLLVAGTELSGAIILSLDERDVEIAFKADRVDADADGLILTDYKTGRPPTGKKPDTRSNNVRKDLIAGTKLQAAAYARCDDGARGRYLFLRPDAADDTRSITLSSTDEAVTEDFPAVVRTILTTLDRGVMFPRLAMPNGDDGVACRWCEVKDACLQQDSGAKARLLRIAERARERLRRDDDVDAYSLMLARAFYLGEGPQG